MNPTLQNHVLLFDEGKVLLVNPKHVKELCTGCYDPFTTMLQCPRCKFLWLFREMKAMQPINGVFLTKFIPQ